MDNYREITPELAVAAQPSEEDLRRLPQEGFAAVVNLRHDGEPEQPLDTTAEGELVRQLGMEYLHYGVGGKPLDREGVDAVCALLNRQAAQGRRVLLHCRKSPRAVALVLIHQALKNNWSRDEAMARGEVMGLKLEGPLRGLVESYLEQHTG